MATGPKKMAEAIIQNLRTKTGRDLTEWMAILKGSGHKEKKPAMEFLKKECGLGHFQAQTIFNQSKGDPGYSDSVALTNALFDSPSLKEAYGALAKHLKSLGSDVREEPCKTYIPFYRKKTFAMVFPASGGGLCLGLNLPGDFSDPVFTPGITKGNKRINFQVVVSDPTALSEAVKAAISLAYQNN